MVLRQQQEELVSPGPSNSVITTDPPPMRRFSAAAILPPIWAGLPGHAPARAAPALSQAQQDRPRPFGRAPGPLAVVFWYACRVRHPRRSRLRAFSMVLAVLAVVPPAAFAAFYCWIVVRDGSALAAVAYEHGRGCGSGS